MRTQLDRLLRLIAKAVTTVWFRKVEVVGRDRLPSSGPMLVVASHFNGLLDPMLVVAIFPHVPRFLAKATLWRNPVVARLLDLSGVVPVHRRSEGSSRGNLATFAATSRALADGDSVALFPEGITHDEPRINRVRTGAARIALAARAAGARNLHIVPVGIVYTSKARPRTRALVRIGEPIDLDRQLPSATRVRGEAVTAAPADSGDGQTGPAPPDVAAVRGLTDEIRRRLADAALDYQDPAFALIAARAAAVALRPPAAPRRWEPSLNELERTARALAAAPAAAQRAVTEAAVPYHDALTLLGLSDADVVAGDLTPTAVRWRLGGLIGVVATAPAAGVGLVVNAPAVGLVWAAGHVPWSAPMRGTARVLAGLVAFPAAWTLLRRDLGRRHFQEPNLATLLAGPGCGLVALGLAERLRALRSARESVVRLREYAAVLPVLSAERQALVAAVQRAVQTADAVPSSAQWPA